MENKKPKKAIRFGFISTDGYFQEIDALSSSDLEYVSKSIDELRQMMAENLAAENYEKCAGLRDEIKKRAIRKN
ncbi:MAG TPA: hypothetical protein VGE26_02120 [Sphingobacteriaceae bacterium]